MSLSSAVSRSVHLGSGSVGPFSISFPFFAYADLEVIKRSSAGAETVLAYSSQWTGTGAGNATGTVTLVTALATGEKLIVRRVPPVTQETSIRSQASYFAGTHEDALDKLAMIDQAQQDQLNRSFRLKRSLDPASYTLELEPEVGKALVWQSATSLGNSTIASTGSVALPGEGRTVATLTAYLLNNAVYNVLDYGAIGDGVTNDRAAIQAALDACAADNTALGLAGGTVRIPFKPLGYSLGTGAGLSIGGHAITIESDGAELKYAGTGKALEGALINGTTYPVNIQLRGINFRLTGAAATGVRANFSYSHLEKIGVVLTLASQKGFDVSGHAGGTGPYYNTYVSCDVQGNALAGQYGWYLGYESAGTAIYTPNACTWVGGRVSSCVVGFRMLGNGNRVYGMTLESCSTIVFDIHNPDAALGCTNNSIRDVYIEGASGVIAFAVGTSSIGTVIDNPYITSIGAGTVLSDTGKNTRFSQSDNTKFPAEGFYFQQRTAASFPEVRYTSVCGWKLRDTALSKNTYVLNGYGGSSEKPFLVRDNTETDILAASYNGGPSSTTPPFIEFGDAMRIYIRNGTPEASVTAPVGTLCMRKDGGAGTCFYVKESGVGNTGWVAK